MEKNLKLFGGSSAVFMGFRACKNMSVGCEPVVVIWAHWEHYLHWREQLKTNPKLEDLPQILGVALELIFSLFVFDAPVSRD
jgi:hypothetical protein